MTAFLRSALNKSETIFFCLLLLFLPTQFGKHFWPSYAFVLGQRIDYLSPTIYVTDILVIVLFVVWIIRYIESRIKNHELRIEKTKIVTRNSYFIIRITFLLLASIFLLLNITFSQVPQEGIYGLVKLLEIGFLTCYTSNFLRTKSKNVYLFISFAIIFESVLAILQFFHGGSLDGGFYYLGERTFTSLTPGIANASIGGELILRPYATFSHPNVLAGFLVIYMTIIISSISLSFQERPRSGVRFGNSQALLKLPNLIWPIGHLLLRGEGKIKSIFFVCVLLIGTFALFLTLSRVAIIVWVLILLFLLIRFIQKKKQYTKYLILNTLLGCLVVLLFIFSPLLPRFTQLSLQDESFVLRERLAIDAIKMIYAHPLLGVGLHNFLIELPSYDFTRSNVFTIQPAHNIFLLIGAETGLIGLWLAVSGVIWMYIRLFTSVKRKALSVKNKQLDNVGRDLQSLSKRFVKQEDVLLAILLLTEVLVLGEFDHYFLTIQQGQLLLGLVLGSCLSTIHIHDSTLKHIFFSVDNTR